MLPAVAMAQGFDLLNDYGGVGLLQTPTARTAADGEFAVGIAAARPYRQLQFSLQLLERVEAVFRYSEVTNRRYGPEDFSGDQTYKDRAVDGKLLLWEEGRYWPAVAVGVRDVGGTGLFSSEFIVASRRWYDFDFSLGLGWGRLGARGDFDNPFSMIADEFDERPDESQPGDVDLRHLFRGDSVALFGGVRWNTPWHGISLLAEWDGNDYQSEALDNDQVVHFPVNLGLNWRPNRYVDTSLALERGSILAARLSFRTNFNEIRGTPKFLDPPMPSAPAAEKPAPPEPAGALAPDTVDRLREALAAQGFALHAIAYDEAREDLRVWFTQGRYRRQGEAFGRLGRVLALETPPQIRSFTLIEIHMGFEAYRVNIVRSEVDRLMRDGISPEEASRSVRVEPPQLFSAWHADHGLNDYPAVSWGTSPGWRQHVGGPDGFYFFQLWWRFGATLALSPRWDVSAQVGADVYNNFDEITLRSDSVLPHVRSDIVRYLQEGETALVRLETNYMFPIASAWYGRLSAGIFEEMYGGVAGEVLWRSFQSPLALGLDVAHVRKRDFDQRFDFLDYEITTGHLTAYYELRPLRSFVQLSYGRYLAGDWGATLNVSHYFDSGVSVGVFATKTNVSAEEFGEGSFDKGFYLNIPMDLFFARSTRRHAPLVFRPLTRDGGQMVRSGRRLYGATTDLRPEIR